MKPRKVVQKWFPGEDEDGRQEIGGKRARNAHGALSRINPAFRMLACYSTLLSDTARY